MSAISSLRTIGPYKLQGKVSDDASSSLYESTNPSSGSRCIVSVFPAELTKPNDFPHRFRAECNAAQQLESLHVAKLVDFDVDDTGFPYLVNEAVEGETLVDTLRRERHIKPEIAIRCISEIAEGLAALHKAGALHRDVRPGSVVLTPYGNVRLTNLGRGGLLPFDQFRLPGGSVLGGAGYLAPEVSLGQPATSQSDLYSLACTAYHLLAGEPPFIGSSPEDIIRKHTSAAPPRLTEVVPALPVAISEIIMECLAKEPSGRYHDLATFLLDWRPVAREAASRMERAEMDKSGSFRGVGGSTDAAPRIRLKTNEQGVTERPAPAIVDLGFDVDPSRDITDSDLRLNDDLAAIMPRKDSFSGSLTTPGSLVTDDAGRPMGLGPEFYGRNDRETLSRLRAHKEPAGFFTVGRLVFIGILLMAVVIGAISVAGGKTPPFIARWFGGGSEDNGEAEARLASAKWNETRSRMEAIPYQVLQYERVNSTKPKLPDLVREKWVTADEINDAYGNEMVYDGLSDEVISLGPDGQRYTADDFVYSVRKGSFTKAPPKPLIESEDEMNVFER